MTDYDQFARFYDAIMGRPEGRIRLVKKLIDRFHPGAHSVLELACGTGSVLDGLGNDYELHGLDRSEKMLEVARGKLPEARFYAGDMSAFELGRKFDVIICVFDSINHLTEFEKWQSLFEHAAKHLNSGGLLIFDMDTISRLKVVALAPFEEVFEGGKAKIKVINEGGLYVWHWDFLEDIGDGRHKVYSEVIAEVSFETTKVRAELAQRFEVKTVCDAGENVATEASTRVYFVGQRP